MKASVVLIGIILLAIGGLIAASNLGMAPISLPLGDEIAGIKTLYVGAGLAIIGLLLTIQGFRMMV